MGESIELAQGFRFNPFEEELITFYLKPKVLGQKLPSNVVEDRQLYGPNANPWQVFDPENHSWILSEVSPGKFEKVTYVFVNLTKKSAVERKIKKAAKENYTKKAGCGTWDGQTKRYEIRDRINGDLIGEKRFLVFEINEVSGLDLSKVGYWKMHEYHLCGVNENISNPSNIVLCKITFDYSKSPPVKLRKNNHDQLIKSASKPQNKNTNMDNASLPPTVNIVDGNQGAVSTQTRRDDSVMFDSFRVEEKQADNEIDIVGTCDPMECMSSDNGKENKSVIASSPSEELNTGHLKPEYSEFFRPAKFDNEYQKSKKDEIRRGNFLFGMTKIQFSGDSKPKEDDSVEDITTDLGKRKIKIEITRPMTKKLSP